jgi:hypothetical protein
MQEGKIILWLMDPAYKGHEFESLKLRYEDQVTLLRSLTAHDMRIFSGFITIQILLGGWISVHPVESVTVKVGLSIIDTVFALIAGSLLYNSYNRRKEVIDTVKNLNEALGYTEKNIYLKDKAINSSYKTKTRFWFWWYIIGIAFAWFGFLLVLDLIIF